MDPRTKAERLSQIDEKELRENILVPLLRRLKYRGVLVYHGPNERGKDVLCYDLDRLRKREYLAVVAKATDLNGDISSSEGLMAVSRQVSQCFNVPYPDLYGMAEVTMDRVWVVTSRRVVPGAAESIYAELAKTNLSKLVRFISGEHLIELIDEHYPEYWSNSLEPIDVVREHRQRLEAFCRKILMHLGGDRSNVDLVLGQVKESDFPPSVVTPQGVFASNLNPYLVELDSIEGPYAHDFYSTDYGLIKPLYVKARRMLYQTMQEVDEILWRYDEVIKRTDPQGFVDAFDEELSDRHPFWKPTWGSASDAEGGISDLAQAISEICELQANLRKIGKLEWAVSLVDSVAKLRDEIGESVSGIDDDEFTLLWSIDLYDTNPRLRMLHVMPDRSNSNTFLTKHSKFITVYNRSQPASRPITVDDVMEEVQRKIREHLDQMLLNKGVIDDPSA